MRSGFAFWRSTHPIGSFVRRVFLGSAGEFELMCRARDALARGERECSDEEWSVISKTRFPCEDVREHVSKTSKKLLAAYRDVSRFPPSPALGEAMASSCEIPPHTAPPSSSNSPISILQFLRKEYVFTRFAFFAVLCCFVSTLVRTMDSFVYAAMMTTAVSSVATSSSDDTIVDTATTSSGGETTKSAISEMSTLFLSNFSLFQLVLLKVVLSIIGEVARKWWWFYQGHIRDLMQNVIHHSIFAKHMGVVSPVSFEIEVSEDKRKKKKKKKEEEDPEEEKEKEGKNDEKTKNGKSEKKKKKYGGMTEQQQSNLQGELGKSVWRLTQAVQQGLDIFQFVMSVISQIGAVVAVLLATLSFARTLFVLLVLFSALGCYWWFFMRERNKKGRTRWREVNEAERMAMQVVRESVEKIRQIKMLGLECVFHERIAELRDTVLKKERKANSGWRYYSVVGNLSRFVISLLVLGMWLLLGGVADENAQGDSASKKWASTVMLLLTLVRSMVSLIGQANRLWENTGSELTEAAETIETFLSQPDVVPRDLLCRKADPSEYEESWEEAETEGEGEVADRVALQMRNSMFNFGAATEAAATQSETENLEKSASSHDSEEAAAAAEESESSTTPSSSDSTSSVASSGLFQLGPLNLKIQKGKFVVIVGKVGSGKSVLLHSLLGECRPSGDDPTLLPRLGCCPKICYFPQKYWIESKKTIRETVCRWAPFEEEKFRATLRMCDLLTDVASLENKDATVLGEQSNVNLSVGQCARLTAARSVYPFVKEEKEIPNTLFLFDDLFASVDVETGDRIFRRLFLRHLKRSTRILVTHKLDFVPFADRVVVMNGGVIEFDGTPRQVEESGFLRGLVNSSSQEEDGMAETPLSPDVDVDEEKLFLEEKKGELAKKPMKDRWFEVLIGSSSGSEGRRLFLIFVLSMILSTVVYEFESYALAHFGISQTRALLIRYFTFYCIARLSSVAANQASEYLRENFTSEITRHYRNRTTAKTLSAKISSYDSIEFAELHQIIDDESWLALQWYLPSLVRGVFRIFISIGIAVRAFPILIVLIAGFFYLARWLDTLRHAGRTVGEQFYEKSRLPLDTHRKESVLGCRVIRAMQEEDHCLSEDLENIQNEFVRGHSLWAIGRWFDYRISLLNGCFVVLYAYLMITYSKGTAGFGFALQKVLGLIRSFRWLLNSFDQTHEKLRSAQKLDEFLERLKPERTDVFASVDATNEPSLHASTEITVSGLSMRYGEEESEQPLVLNDVNFALERGEHVVLRGRTGCGKTSLVNCLIGLRDYESGSIVLNDRDSSEIPLNLLRRQISVICQDPVLFDSLSLRKNLDPDDNLSDERLWELLARVSLREGLDDDLTANLKDIRPFSLGEQQLLCFIRALSRDSPVLIMDEPTSSCDLRTEEVLMKLIEEESAGGKTMITISHRVRDGSIDTRRVLYLRDGRIECDDDDEE